MLRRFFKQKGKGIANKEIYPLLNVKKRRFQQLYAEYKMTGKIPELKQNRRPKTALQEEDKVMIGRALQESKMTGAVYLQLYIKKHYGKNIPHNKIHKYLLVSKIAQED